jgi:NADPH:quinone reductase-like Zn-dependent oxidoreductase
MIGDASNLNATHLQSSNTYLYTMSSDQVLLPDFQCAIQQGDDGRPRFVNEAAIPSLPPGFVLVKTIAVALNPSDHKIMKNFPIQGAYIGADFSGTVVQIANGTDEGPGTGSLKVGTMVCGAAFGFAPMHRKANGAFAEYVRARADLLLILHETSNLDLQPRLLQAATLGTAISTCLLALWSSEALGLLGTPDKPTISEKPEPVLVYGGSTATGTIALQLLKFSGYSPIATCSPRNFDLVRERGASAVFNYAAPDVAQSIKEHTSGRLKYVLDCISNVDSVATCYQAIQRPGGRYVCLERIPEEVLAKRRAVRSTFVLAAEAYGDEIKLGQEGYDRPANQEKHEFAAQCIKMYQRLLDQGRLKTHPMEMLDGGLHGIIRGLEMLENGGVPGKKLVALL